MHFMFDNKRSTSQSVPSKINMKLLEKTLKEFKGDIEYFTSDTIVDVYGSSQSKTRFLWAKCSWCDSDSIRTWQCTD